MTQIVSTALFFALAFPAIAFPQDSLKVVRGTPPTDPAPAENFTGTVWVGNPIQAPATARTYGATVAFEPAARTYWHVHPFGQTPRRHGRHRTNAALGRSGSGDPAR